MSLSLRNLVVAAALVISSSMVAENASAGGCQIGGYGGGYSQGSYGYGNNQYGAQGASYRHASHAVPLPKFGFTYVTCGHGLRVNYVAYGCVAYRLGLQCDDVIISLNHRLVLTGADWHRELAFAMRHGGCIELEVRKCHGPVEIMIVTFGAVPGGVQTPVGGVQTPVGGVQTPVGGVQTPGIEAGEAGEAGEASEASEASGAAIVDPFYTATIESEQVEPAVPAAPAENGGQQ